MNYQLSCYLETRPDFVRDDFCLSDFLGGKPYGFGNKHEAKTIESTKVPNKLTIGDKIGRYIIKDICDGHFLLEDITNKMLFICAVVGVSGYEDFVSTSYTVDTEGNIVRSRPVGWVRDSDDSY